MVERALENTRFPFFITALFSLVAAFGMYHHEMWRDELEIFMKMRDVASLNDLFPKQLPFPTPYFVFMFFIIKAFPYFTTYKIYHLVIIISAVYIFNRYSPFNKVQKTLFTFSYFILFEYGIICRGYSMLLLYIFAAIYMITEKEKNYIFIVILFFLLANNDLFGIILSTSLFVYYVLYLIKKKERLIHQERRKFISAGIILCVGCLLILIQLFILYQYNRFSNFGPSPWFMTLKSVWNAFFPVPNTTGIHFWGSNIFPSPVRYPQNVEIASYITPGNILAATASVLILFICSILFSDNLPVLCAYLVGTILESVWLQYLSIFFVRYAGPLFIIFICNYWLFLHSRKESGDSLSCHKKKFLNKLIIAPIRNNCRLFLNIVLSVQCCVGIFAYIQDQRYPFSASYATATYIAEQKLDDLIMVGSVDYAVQAIAAHLNKKIYFLESREFRTYVDWFNRKKTVSSNTLFNECIRLHTEYKKDVLLVLNYPLLGIQKNDENGVSLKKDIKIKCIEIFEESIVANECYYLYRIYSSKNTIEDGIILQ